MPVASPPGSASPCIAAALRAASRRMTALYDEALAPSGLRVTQFHLLAELQRRGADVPTVSELASILTMERSALGQTLRPLERQGFVAIGSVERDHRRRSVRLTAAGAAAVARARPRWARAHAAVEGVLGPAPLAALRSTLREIARDGRIPEAVGATVREIQAGE